MLLMKLTAECDATVETDRLGQSALDWAGISLAAAPTPLPAHFGSVAPLQLQLLLEPVMAYS